MLPLHHARALVVGLAALGCGASLTGAPTRTESETNERDPLAIDYGVATFAETPALAAYLARSPFGYFRYVNRAFNDAVCDRYGSVLKRMPDVNLHGDAHVEQYAVAADGRGLADFDAASLGPPVVDLVRFATSLLLARPDDEEGARASVASFLRGYAKALEDPNAEGPEPTVAKKMRERFAPNARVWLANAQSLIAPPDPSELPRLRAGYQPYVEAMLEQNPGLTESFFKPKTAGVFRAGVGSAHVKKYLMRTEGATTADDDDVILELKQVERGSLARCVHRSGDDDANAERVIRAQARMSSGTQRFLGSVVITNLTFYVHAWRLHYTELSTSQITSAAQLGELAYDVGLQLGRGHPKELVGPGGGTLCSALRVLLTDLEPTIYPTSRALAVRIVDASKAFAKTLPAP